jgi:hypothetical protein
MSNFSLGITTSTPSSTTIGSAATGSATISFAMMDDSAVASYAAADIVESCALCPFAVSDRIGTVRSGRIKSVSRRGTTRQETPSLLCRVSRDVIHEQRTLSKTRVKSLAFTRPTSNLEMRGERLAPPSGSGGRSLKSVVNLTLRTDSSVRGTELITTVVHSRR